MNAWPSTRISDFCSTGSGGTPSRSDTGRYYDGGTIPWIKSGEHRESVITKAEEHITEAAVRESSAKLVPSGALLLAMYGATVGRLGILGIPATTNQAVCHIIPDPKVANLRFLFHAISEQVPNIVARGVGGAQPNISQGIIRDLKIPLPPLPEQRRIAEVLDRAEGLRAKRRESLILLENLSQGIFENIFGDPFSNSKNWKKKRLDECSDQINDCPHSTPIWTESGIICLRTSNLSEGDWNWSDKRFVSESTYIERSKRGKLEPGDIVLSREGTVGIAAIVGPGTRMCMGQRLVQIRADTSILLPEFLLKFLLSVTSPVRISQFMVGSTSQHLNVKDLRALSIPVPPLNLQQEFARRIAAVEKLKATHRASLAQLDALFASLQHRAFRGEL